MITYDEQILKVLDHAHEAVVGDLVLTELALVGDADRLASTRRRRVGTYRSSGQVEEGRSQANGQIAGRHLVDRRQRRHVRQERQERLQRLAVLVRQQQHGAAQRVQSQLHWNHCFTITSVFNFMIYLFLVSFVL